ncbi:MAG: hypothetical protein JSS20_18250, partial [Proteobacteria bacterium]|nr:hypothetical protein [Pseudomonadota bacterium]
MSEDDSSAQEIVIVRRRGGGHDDGHHGGAWKIAFADFMTALMCFFLVMWLINSTDKKTVTQIASYFNPLKLNDRQSSEKGVQDPTPTLGHKSERAKKTDKKPEKAEGTGAAPKNDATQPAVSDQELLRDPYEAIAKIARDATPNRNALAPLEPRGATGLPLDPFEPLAKRAQPVPSASGNETKRDSAPAPGRSSTTPEGEKPPGGQAVDAERNDGAFHPASSKEGKEIQRRLSKALEGFKPGAKPDVEITESKTEIMISLTDEFDFGMFAVGAARPTPELIKVMDQVAKVLVQEKGSITVRGHTDARQYHS